MRRRLILVALVIAPAVIRQSALGQELLTNPSLELVFPDFGGRDSVPPGWKMDEGPPVIANPDDLPYAGDYNNNGIVDTADYVLWRRGGPLQNEGASMGMVDSADYDYWRAHFGLPPRLSMAEPSNFDHIMLVNEGDWQMWFQPYYGSDAMQEDNFAHLYQDVPGTPGLSYTVKGWADFETYFPGGVDNLNAAPGGVASGAPFDDGPPSPTDSFFALEFLDVNNSVLTGSVVKELKADGQPVTPAGEEQLWMQHTLSAVAPAGTVKVRVRASMIDGVFNPLPPPQIYKMSFFVDGFSLTATPGAGSGAPEPSTLLLFVIATGVVGTFRRSTARRA